MQNYMKFIREDILPLRSLGMSVAATLGIQKQVDILIQLGICALIRFPLVVSKMFREL
jgi:hypothetical protein